MEYIAPQQYPGAFTDTTARVLQTISRLGVWMVAPKDLNHDQLRAILALRNAGYIEYAAPCGYKVRANEYTVAKPPAPTAADDVGAKLAALGIVSTRAIVEAKGPRKRPGSEPSWVVILDKDAKIPPAAWDAFQATYLDGRMLIVQFKKAS